MTEEEVQVALSKADASGEVSGPDWPQGSQPRIPVSDGRSRQAQLSPKGGSLLLSEMAALGRVLGPPTQALHCSHQQALLPLQLQGGWWESF